MTQNLSFDMPIIKQRVYKFPIQRVGFWGCQESWWAPVATLRFIVPVLQTASEAVNDILCIVKKTKQQKIVAEAIEWIVSRRKELPVDFQICENILVSLAANAYC